MRKFALAFLVVLCAGFASALTLNAPSEIPSNVNWSFSAQFASNSFTEAKFYLDGTDFTTVYPYNGVLLVAPNSTNQTIAQNVIISGSTVFVSMNGTTEGSHTLKVNVFTGSDVSDSGETTIVVSKSGVNDSVQKQLDSLQGSVNSFAVEMNTIKAAIEELKKGNPATEQKLSELSSAMDALQQKLVNVDGEIYLLIADVESARQGTAATMQNTAQAQNSDTNSNAAIAGFFSLFSASNILWGIIGVIIIAAVLAFIFLAKQGKISMPQFGSRSYDASELMGSGGIKEASDQRKWAFESENKRIEKPSKGFGFGNLIKRR